MGRCPKDIHAHLIGDLLVVRLRSVLTAAEGAGKAVAKIDEAMKLMEAHHKGTHDMMKQHMQKMYKDMMGKGMADDEMKCPM